MAKANKSKVSTKSVTKTSSFGMEPVSGFVLIEPQEAETKTAGGILLPETASGEKPQKGKVLAVGPQEVTEYGIKRDSPCKVGDIVLYKKWGGNEVKIGTKEYLFVKFEDILAIQK